MAVTRAQALTGTSKKSELFSDFVTSFAKTPYGDQLGRVTNEKAVIQSLRNIILTNTGERPFQPNIGGDVNRMLFEQNVPGAINMLEFQIQNAIEISEPRVNLINLTIDNSPNDYAVNISITFNLINNPAPISFSLVLKRVR